METNKYYLYEDKNSLYRFKFEVDDDAYNPRADDDGIFSHIASYDCGINILSDEYKNAGHIQKLLVEEALKLSPSKILKDLINGILDDKEFITHTGDGRVIYGRVGNTDIVTTLVYPNDEEATNDILYDNLTMAQLTDLLRANDYVIVFFDLCEHSGQWLSFASVKIENEFNSHNGIILTTKEDVLKNTEYTEENWRSEAVKMLYGELQTFNDYLQGNVYGYVIEEHNGFKWTEIDSLWGIYPTHDTTDELEEITVDYVTQAKLYEENTKEADELIERYTNKVLTSLSACYI